MELKPLAALEALFQIIQRTPLSPAETIGAQACIDVIKTELEKSVEPKPEPKDVA